MKKQKNEYLIIKNPLKYFIFMSLYFVLLPFCKLFFGRKNKWVICERGDDAQDNGYAFFKFLCEKHPEIEAVYLIKKNSADYKKASAIGKTIHFGSLKHLLLIIGCHVKISSHLFGYSPWAQLSTYYRRHRTKDIHVFLQHGIIKNIHEGLFRETCNSLSLFVCGAKPEYESILTDFHYNNSVPKYTGLARYDSLFSFQTNNQILIMPTWRRRLISMNEEEFLNSDFFKNWNNLLNSNAILDECKKRNIVIKFYLHFMLQKFSHLFAGNDIVTIVNFKDEPVQKLLKESNMLVTDFSSVYFDFGYMHKPIVHFQFDEEEYYRSHYEKGYFDYRRDGFGNICTSLSDAISSINSLIKNGFILEKKYLRRIQQNFVYHDCNNCERIFNAIQDIKQ